MRRLAAATFVVLSGTTNASAQPKAFPPDIAVDVKSFGARGDGVTDDTAAIQAAMRGDRIEQSQPDYYAPRPRVVYFPPGTYVVTNTLEWIGCALQLQGAGAATVLKLRDGTPAFGDKGAKKPVLRTPDGNYSFKEHVFDLVIDTGKGNPGAVGLDWIANNVGALRGVTIRSGDGQGVAGLDMTRAWPGPALVRDLVVDGFDVGIDVAHPEYGPTFEEITLSNQKVAALRNVDNVLAIRRLKTSGAPVAVESSGANGMVILLDSLLVGPAGAGAAIVNRGQVYLRNVEARGYANVVSENGAAVPGTKVAGEYRTGKIQELFPSPARSLSLPIEDVPSFHDDDLTRWSKIDCGYQGCEDVVERALQAGKPTVWMSAGVRLIGSRAFRVPAGVRRVLGFGTNVNEYDAYGLTFLVEDDAPEPVLFEQFANQLRVVHRSRRTVVIKSSDIAGYVAEPGAGKLFLDDVNMSLLRPAKGQRVWARQLNIEGPQLHVDNDGAFVFIFGLKSEGKGTIAKTTGGGYTELLGTLLYPTQSFTEEDGPAFVNVESSHSLVFASSNYVPDGFYPRLVEETRDGVTKTLPVSALEGRHLPLFVGYK